MIHREMLKTSSTVPGQMVMRVFMTKRVLKLILLSAPMLRDEASVKSLLCSSMTRAIRYRRRNMGMERMMSTSASAREAAAPMKPQDSRSNLTADTNPLLMLSQAAMPQESSPAPGPAHLGVEPPGELGLDHHDDDAKHAEDERVVAEAFALLEERAPVPEPMHPGDCFRWREHPLLNLRPRSLQQCRLGVSWACPARFGELRGDHSLSRHGCCTSEISLLWPHAVGTRKSASLTWSQSRAVALLDGWCVFYVRLTGDIRLSS
ncbi:uncharacterized protein LOC120390473 [Mauremys reevesii]|uniref:uncharacterized protein LOC120390473 n=1 Tax=Mauremys reevesii TaxID=260615 RepID=UPI00193F42EB|nr:uncharacterized protein LOC120390473 [Mauremys reevesii]